MAKELYVMQAHWKPGKKPVNAPVQVGDQFWASFAVNGTFFLTNFREEAFEATKKHIEMIRDEFYELDRAEMFEVTVLPAGEAEIPIEMAQLLKMV